MIESNRPVIDVAVILAGGFGTRLSEETISKPKPMVEIGGMPIIWHIMKFYSSFGVNRFIICCGYKSLVLKKFFADYYMEKSDITFDLKSNDIHVHSETSEPWTVTLVDTGIQTGTGGRLKRVANYLEDVESFAFTYGDGLCDVDLNELVSFHKANNRLATVTGVYPPGRFGSIVFDKDSGAVTEFLEKPRGDGGLISGGFFILGKEVLNLIDGDSTSFELEPLDKLVALNQICVYEHQGFWHAMDTLRDKNHLNELWNRGAAPWKVWD